MIYVIATVYQVIMLISILAFLSFVEVIQSSTGKRTLIYSKNNGYIPPYHQLMNNQDSLWCVGSSNSSTASWILPDGNVIKMTALGGDSLLLPSMSASLSGVYTCEVTDYTVDGTIKTQHVWIVQQHDELPLVKTYNCLLESSLVYKNLYVILITARVHMGAPSNVNCHLVNNPSYKLIQVSKDRQLEDRCPNATISKISVGYLIPFSMTPNDVQCMVNNNDGASSFKCLIRESTLKPPVIENIIKKTMSQYIIQWNPIKGNELDYYKLYYITTNDNTQTHRTSSTKAIISNTNTPLIEKSLLITAESKQSRSDLIILPSIGRLKGQCRPSIGAEIEIQFESSDIEQQYELIDDVLDSLYIPESCKIIPPNITGVTVTEIVVTKTPKFKTAKKPKTEKSKKSKTIKSKKPKTIKSKKPKTGKSKKPKTGKSKKTKPKTKSVKTKKSKKTKKKKSKRIKRSRTRTCGNHRKILHNVTANVIILCNPCDALSSFNSDKDYIIYNWLANIKSLGITRQGLRYRADVTQRHYCNYEVYNSNMRCNCPTTCATPIH